jgi:IS5 family transposase
VLKPPLTAKKSAHLVSKSTSMLTKTASSKPPTSTAGNVHGSNVFTSLLSDKDSAAYADSAYPSKKHSEWLAERGIEDRMIARAHRNKPLTDAQKAQNRLWARTRCRVERTFGILKLHYVMAKARYVGLKRNAMRVGLMCLAYKMKRGLSLGINPPSADKTPIRRAFYEVK